MKYEVSSLHVGTFVMNGKEDPIHAWLIRGGGRTVLVDAGTPEPEIVRDKWRTECPVGGPDMLVAGLKEHGVDVEDVDTVVLTHLHFDHAWNVDLFRNAQAVVQRSEIIHAIDPTPTHRGYYNQALNARVITRKKPQQLQIIDGDRSLADGIRVMWIPGHTPGIMGVIVETERGLVGLSSDAGENYANWYPADPRVTSTPTRFLQDAFLPPHIWTESATTCIASLRRFREACDIVVPSHDWRIPKNIPAEWWAIPGQ